jgi:hypothetical protein
VPEGALLTSILGKTTFRTPTSLVGTVETKGPLVVAADEVSGFDEGAEGVSTMACRNF